MQQESAVHRVYPDKQVSCTSAHAPLSQHLPKPRGPAFKCHADSTKLSETEAKILVHWLVFITINSKEKEYHHAVKS